MHMFVNSIKNERVILLRNKGQNDEVSDAETSPAQATQKFNSSSNADT